MIDSAQIITTLVALTGWLAVSLLTSWRDRVNHKRKIKTDFLIKAYQDLSDASGREATECSPYFRKMESAISDIQLFSKASQIDLVNNFLHEFSKNGQAPLNPILDSLRNELRLELDAEKVSFNVKWFRPESAPTLPNPQ